MTRRSAKPGVDARAGLKESTGQSWLLLVFSLPAKRSSQRVEVWRKLRRIGALALGPPGYLLPYGAQNHEQFEWLSTTIRGHKGQASVIHVSSIDDLPAKELIGRFNEARSRDYQELLQQLAGIRRRLATRQKLAGARRRLEGITSIDFFNCPARNRVEAQLLDALGLGRTVKNVSISYKHEFKNKTWVTRPRPGIDRVSSAWLIKKFIDPGAKFVFAMDAAEIPDAVPFDMFESVGFTHQGEQCTFETLCREFRVRDPKVRVIAQIIHDADLRDEKFGRSEGAALEAVLAGWANQFAEDHKLLSRGMEMIEGLYSSVQ